MIWDWNISSPRGVEGEKITLLLAAPLPALAPRLQHNALALAAKRQRHRAAGNIFAAARRCAFENGAMEDGRASSFAVSRTL